MPEKNAPFSRSGVFLTVTTLEHLQELVLLEEFKNCVPESVVVHLNDQKVTSLADAAVLADEFALTHKSVFTTVRRNLVPLTSESSAREKAYDSSRARIETPSNSPRRKSIGKRACFFCLDSNHLISDC